METIRDTAVIAAAASVIGLAAYAFLVWKPQLEKQLEEEIKAHLEKKLGGLYKISKAIG